MSSVWWQVLQLLSRRRVCNRSLYLHPSDLLFRESHNRILRDLAVLGYLGQLMPPVPKPLGPLHGLTPYQVSGTWRMSLFRSLKRQFCGFLCAGHSCTLFFLLNPHNTPGTCCSYPISWMEKLNCREAEMAELAFGPWQASSIWHRCGCDCSDPVAAPAPVFVNCVWLHLSSIAWGSGRSCRVVAMLSVPSCRSCTQSVIYLKYSLLTLGKLQHQSICS
jgi:hypothetical protein